jgi:hypothetical protein
MLTSRAIWPNLLQLNKLHYIKYIEDTVVLGIQCEIHTRILTTPELSPQRVRRLELLCQLHDQGLSDQTI